MKAIQYTQITEEQFDSLPTGERIKCEDRSGRMHVVEKRYDGSVYFYPDCGWTGRRVDRETILSAYRFCLRDPEADWNVRLNDVIARLQASGLNMGFACKLRQLKEIPYRDVVEMKGILDDMRAERPVNMGDIRRLNKRYPCFLDQEFLIFLIMYMQYGDVRPIECGEDSGIDMNRIRRLARKPKNCELKGGRQMFIFRKNGREAGYGLSDPEMGKIRWGILLDETTALLLFDFDPSKDPFRPDAAVWKQRRLRRRRSSSDNLNEKSA